MASRRQGSKARIRVGIVSVYQHHGSWWVYYREGAKPVRRKICREREPALQMAAHINAQLAVHSPSHFAFEPISISELRKRFLDYHEHVLNSALATVRRYRSATLYLERFAAEQFRRGMAHELKADQFAGFLRQVEVGANARGGSTKQKLRDKGVRHILETCRSMYAFAGRHRHLPPYAGNPFALLPLERFKVEDPKPIFVFDARTELAFLQACDSWAFAVHFTLAKTGLRVGELTHLLIEDVDLPGGWLYVRNKSELGWRIKTGVERVVPLLPELLLVMHRVVGKRSMGVLFLRPRCQTNPPPLLGNRAALVQELRERHIANGGTLSRAEAAKLAESVWRDAGAIDPNAIRMSFLRIAASIGHPEATCPKSWRHTFATLLQDANVDPLIRQRVLGHTPTQRSGLGMTAVYTHTRPETARQQLQDALRRWPESLRLVEGGVR